MLAAIFENSEIIFIYLKECLNLQLSKEILKESKCFFLIVSQVYFIFKDVCYDYILYCRYFAKKSIEGRQKADLIHLTNMDDDNR